MAELGVGDARNSVSTQSVVARDRLRFLVCFTTVFPSHNCNSFPTRRCVAASSTRFPRREKEGSTVQAFSYGLQRRHQHSAPPILAI
jgi:hypothetical protein